MVPPPGLRGSRISAVAVQRCGDGRLGLATEFAGVRDGPSGDRCANALCAIQWRSNGVDALPACGEYMGPGRVEHQCGADARRCNGAGT